MNRDKVGSSPSLSSSFPVDIERSMFNIKDLFNPLHDDYALEFQIQRVGKDRAIFSVVMPEGMIGGFVSLLQSLHGFFRFAEMKERVSKCQEQAIDPGEIAERQEIHATFQKKVCEIFDALIGQGLERKEAVKRTGEALKAKNHPWANRDAVLHVLRAAGRLRRKEVKP
jgi:hypothetical protein